MEVSFSIFKSLETRVDGEGNSGYFCRQISVEMQGGVEGVRCGGVEEGALWG